MLSGPIFPEEEAYMRRIVYSLAAGTFAVILAAPVFAQTTAQPANPMAASAAGQNQPQPNSPMAAGGSAQAQPNSPMAPGGSAQNEAPPNSPMAAPMAPSGSGTTGTTTMESGGASTADLNAARYNAWDQFRSANPKIASELKHNPKLAANPAFVDRNPQLKQLFEANAGMQEDMQRNPGNYLAGARYSAKHRHHHHHHAENKA
jgi:hypothetical protein